MNTNLFAKKDTLHHVYNTPLNGELVEQYASLLSTLELEPRECIVIPTAHNGVDAKLTISPPSFSYSKQVMSMTMISPLSGATDYLNFGGIDIEKVSNMSLLALADKVLLNHVNNYSKYSFITGEESRTESTVKWGAKDAVKIVCRLKGKSDSSKVVAPRKFLPMAYLPCHTNKQMIDTLKKVGFCIKVDSYNKQISAFFPVTYVNPRLSQGLINQQGESEQFDFVGGVCKHINKDIQADVSGFTKPELEDLLDETASASLECSLVKARALLSPLFQSNTRFEDQHLLAEQILTIWSSMESNKPQVFAKPQLSSITLNDDGQGSFDFH